MEGLCTDNPKVIVKASRHGKSLFADGDIEKGEVVAVFDGPVYEAERSSDLPNDPTLCVRDHAIQFAEHRWRDSNGIARCINHSCEPNCGIKRLFDIVAMRDIRKGEELTMDYDVTENSDWQMKCECGSTACRKVIRGYRYLPQEIRDKYKGYVSEWLTKE